MILTLDPVVKVSSERTLLKNSGCTIRLDTIGHLFDILYAWESMDLVENFGKNYDLYIGSQIW